MSLERVLGLTVSGNTTLALDPKTGVIAYSAGCVIVLYDPEKNEQSHIFSRKPLTCIAFSGDGSYLATGESGNKPAVRIWNVESKTQVAELLDHDHGISCVAFSPDSKFVVSVGFDVDGLINVWRWKQAEKDIAASSRIKSKVLSIAFSEDGTFFVTVGKSLVRFWSLETTSDKPAREEVPLRGKNAFLGEHGHNDFYDVVTGKGNKSNHAFCITKRGKLFEFNDQRRINKNWKDMKINVKCLSGGDDYVYVGGSNGTVRVYDTNLTLITSLPKPHHLGIDVSTASTNDSGSTGATSKELKYPGTNALRVDHKRKKAVCIYSDHSLYIWDVNDLNHVTKVWSFLYHSSIIWGLELYPPLLGDDKAALPPDSFLTCSSDDTIRLWNLNPAINEIKPYKRNNICPELLKVMYTDPALTHLCEKNIAPVVGPATETLPEESHGIRCLAVSPDGQELASGDCNGSISIYDLHCLENVKHIEPHKGNISSLEYSRLEHGPKLLGSASHDRHVHVYDVDNEYKVVQTLYHQSSIRALKFIETEKHLKLITCSADKCILIRKSEKSTVHFDQGLLMSKGTGKNLNVYDIVIDPTQKFMATAAQDRAIRIYNIKSGVERRHYKGSTATKGKLSRLVLDPSGTYAATIGEDKNVYLVDFHSGEIRGLLMGHSMRPTDIKFTYDFEHVVSVSGDSCIFVWKLPKEMTEKMKSRLLDRSKLFGSLLAIPISADNAKVEDKQKENRDVIVPTDAVSMTDIAVEIDPYISPSVTENDEEQLLNAVPGHNGDNPESDVTDASAGSVQHQTQGTVVIPSTGGQQNVPTGPQIDRTYRIPQTPVRFDKTYLVSRGDVFVGNHPEKDADQKQQTEQQELALISQRAKGNIPSTIVRQPSDSYLIDMSFVRTHVRGKQKQSKEVEFLLGWISSRFESTLTDVHQTWMGYQACNPSEPVLVAVHNRDVQETESSFQTFKTVHRTVGHVSSEGKDVARKEIEMGLAFTFEERISIHASLSKHSKKLMQKHSNLQIVGASKIKSRRYGEKNAVIEEMTCIVLYVDIKGVIPFNEEPFPREIDGYPVDVREGMFRLFTNPTEYQEILSMGCQISSAYNTYGTLGGFVDLNNGKIGCLTCWHVFLSSGSKEDLRTGALSKKRFKREVSQPDNTKNTFRFGFVRDAVLEEGDEETIGVDAALVEITDTKRAPVQTEILYYGNKQAGTAEDAKITYKSGEIVSDFEDVPTTGSVVKCGTKTGKTNGVTRLTGVAVKNGRASEEHEAEVYSLHQQMEVCPMTDNATFADIGDSGSLVFLVTGDQHEQDRDNLKALGLIVGGTTYNTTIVTPLWAVLEKLGLPPKLSCEEKQPSHFVQAATELEAKLPKSVTQHEISALRTDIGAMKESIDERFQTLANGIKTEMGEKLRNMDQSLQTMMDSIGNQLKSLRQALNLKH